MKNREQIEEKYKWDLELFKTDEEIEKVFSYIEKLTKVMPSYSGKLADKNKLYEVLYKYRKEEIEIDKLVYYVFNTYSVDNSNTRIIKLNTRLNNALAKLSASTAFIGPQLYELPDKYLLEIINDKKFSEFDNFFKDIIKMKPHKLDEKTSEIVAKLNKSLNQNAEIYDIINHSEIYFDDALDSKGKSHKIDNSSCEDCLISTDRELRKNAYYSLKNAFKRFNKTFAALLLGDMTSDFNISKLKNFNSQLEAALIEDDVPKAVFDKNILEVTKNIKILQEYVKIRAKKSGLKDFAIYDLNEDKKINGKVSIEKAQATIINALAPLGEEYIKNVKIKFNDKSIDYMPNKNKSTGGYSNSAYGCKPIILMNWKNNYDSMSTLAHEMGHCINSVYILSSQPREKCGVVIPLAEIASTVNEILLINYMISHCPKNQKEYYLQQLFDLCRGTIFTQTLFAEFELFAHTNVDNETPITYEDLNNKFFELLKKYYGKSCVIPEYDRYGWSRIPHFYQNYYVYSYSTGMITAISIVAKLLTDKNYYKKYIEFLKNGSSKSFMEILKYIGIDLTTDEPYETAFNFLKEKLKEYKNC